MNVLRLGFENFRNLEDGEIEPCDRTNVIYGDNAQGKTNLLEALWLFTGGHSFRGAKDSELIKIGEKKTSLNVDFFSGERQQNAKLNIVGGRRNSVINGVEKKTGSALIGKICAIIFSPEHLLLIKEGPSRRRGFIDGALCQIKAGYTKKLVIYNRLLLQRNTLLKDLTRLPELRKTLYIWNERLASLGAEVISERVEYILNMKPKLCEIYDGISRKNESIGLRYFTNVKNINESLEKKEIERILLEELKKSERSDIRSGFTSIGPHRDDIEITINGISARIYGSQGQQRSAVLAMKLSEAELLFEKTGEKPLILLDDVMSELDGSRQDYLLNHLDERQVFITCCNPETAGLMKDGRLFNVKSGKVRRE